MTQDKKDWQWRGWVRQAWLCMHECWMRTRRNGSYFTSSALTALLSDEYGSLSIAQASSLIYSIEPHHPFSLDDLSFIPFPFICLISLPTPNTSLIFFSFHPAGLCLGFPLYLWTLFDLWRRFALSTANYLRWALSALLHGTQVHSPLEEIWGCLISRD